MLFRSGTNRGGLARIFLAVGLTAALAQAGGATAYAEESNTTVVVDETAVASEEYNGAAASEAQVSQQVSATDVDAVIVDDAAGSEQDAADEGAALPDVTEASSDEASVPNDEQAASEASVTDEQAEAASDAVDAQDPAATEVAQDELSSQAAADDSAVAEPDSLMNMYRLYNPNSGEHFYTSDLEEAKNVAKAGWRWEGIGWVSPIAGDEVHRLYNPNAGDHHYTTDASERDNLVTKGWKYEGVGWYSGGSKWILREYNPNAKSGSHNFTADPAEHETLVKAGWRDEGKAWLASDQTSLPLQGFWLICGSWGGVERYWVAADGNIAKERFVTTDEGSGYNAYATSKNGAILRGSQDMGNGTVLLADNDGRLATGTGFVKSSSYGVKDATYHLKDTGKGYSVAQSGHVLVGNDHYWGQAKTGAILKGKLDIDGGVLVASKSTGKLAWADGWLISDAYDGSMQRYYFQSSSNLGGVKLAKTGVFVVDGKRYLGLAGQGYVARNMYTNKEKGYIYLTDNDGVLDNDGWVITSKYAGTLQRYYVDPTVHAVIVGHNEVAGKHYYSLENVGYVIRGKQIVEKLMVFADNDGSLAWHKGWVITSGLEGAKQTERYYFDEVKPGGLRGARTGLFTVDGKRYYGREDTGYVVRGVYVISRFYGDSANAHGDVWHDDVVAIGNNDGVLMTREEFGQGVVRAARTQIGAAYTTDDNAYYPGIAFNCSGLTWWAYDQMGVHLPHNQGYHSYYYQQENIYNSQMYSVEKRGGWKNSTSGLQAGDLVFFSPAGDKYRTGHVGIYIGNDQMIDCTPPGGCMIRSVYSTSGFVGGGFPITLI